MARGSRDAGTKIDQPSDQEGKGTPAKEEVETREAAQAAEAAKGSTPSEDPGRAGGEGVAEAEKKAKPRRKPATKKGEGTAAEATGVDKAAAEAGLAEGSTEAPAAPTKPKRTRKPKAKPADAPPEGAEPAADAAATGAGDPEAAATVGADPVAADAAATQPATDVPAEEAAAEPEVPADDVTPAEPAAPVAPAPRAGRRDRKQADDRVTVRAQAKYVRTSARKARLVAEHVRGKDVDEARAILAHASRAVAEDWRKLLESAIANAEHNHDLVGDDLRVLYATADEGPTLKRYQPRAMGRATRIRKRTSHLTITLTPKE